MTAPNSRSSSMLPERSYPGSTTASRPRMIPRWHSMLSFAQAAATWRTVFDCTTPPHTTQSAPSANAAPSENSSLRTLLPPPPSPVQSSRLTHSEPSPTAAPRRRIGSSGVGKCANRTRGNARKRASGSLPLNVDPMRALYQGLVTATYAVAETWYARGVGGAAAREAKLLYHGSRSASHGIGQSKRGRAGALTPPEGPDRARSTPTATSTTSPTPNGPPSSPALPNPASPRW